MYFTVTVTQKLRIVSFNMCKSFTITGKVYVQCIHSGTNSKCEELSTAK